MVNFRIFSRPPKEGPIKLNSSGKNQNYKAKRQKDPKTSVTA
jgi:hypothetical protein